MIPPVFDNSYAALPPQFFEPVTPDISPDPTTVLLNTTFAHDIGLDVDWLKSTAGQAMMSGQKMPKNANPIATVYGGHQFGHWSGRLGDGRACLVGEIIGPDDIRRDIVLKGSGPTPFARRGDGKSALGPVLREYIVSEAMAAYGVPTTRALAALTTGASVMRGETLPGGILVRVAKSHVRIGTFQYFYADGDLDGLKALTNYIITRHFPEAFGTSNPTLSFLKSVIADQASLIAKWMGLGFIHGVMNTDNVQIAGETLDYGPCAFMDTFHPQKTFSSIDHNGRYAWGSQPQIGLWNLTQLAQALSPLLDVDEPAAASLAQKALDSYSGHFQSKFRQGFADKLGLNSDVLTGDFLQTTFAVMAEQGVDFTLFFRHLTGHALGGDTHNFCANFRDIKAGEDWLKLWRERAEMRGKIPKDKTKIMQKSNPVYIPRNHRIEHAIQAGRKGDFSPFINLVTALSTPYTATKQHEDLENPPQPDEIITQTFCGT